VLMRGDYPTEYVNAVRSMVGSNVTSYAALGLAEGNDFERGYVHQLLLALDSYFTHRGRGQEGKDGNPLNEVRMITDSLQGNDGHGPIVPVLVPNSTIKYKAEKSVLGLAIGDPLDLNVAQYEELAVAFLDELEKKFPPR
jgi:hypothetical protein